MHHLILICISTKLLELNENKKYLPKNEAGICINPYK